MWFRWEHWSEEAYEGWGWGEGAGVVNDAGASASTSVVAEDVERGNSTFGGMFRRPGVVYPIHPTGHMRLPRPKLPFKEDGTGGNEGRVTFVVQVRGPCEGGGGRYVACVSEWMGVTATPFTGFSAPLDNDDDVLTSM